MLICSSLGFCLRGKICSVVLTRVEKLVLVFAIAEKFVLWIEPRWQKLVEVFVIVEKSGLRFCHSE